MERQIVAQYPRLIYLHVGDGWPLNREFALPKTAASKGEAVFSG